MKIFFLLSNLSLLSKGNFKHSTLTETLLHNVVATETIITEHNSNQNKRQV